MKCTELPRRAGKRDLRASAAAIARSATRIALKLLLLPLQRIQGKWPRGCLPVKHTIPAKIEDRGWARRIVSQLKHGGTVKAPVDRAAMSFISLCSDGKHLRNRGIKKGAGTDPDPASFWGIRRTTKRGNSAGYITSPVWPMSRCVLSILPPAPSWASPRPSPRPARSSRRSS